MKTLITCTDLPNSTLPSIGTVSSAHLFPIAWSLQGAEPFKVHFDGSVFGLFAVPRLDLPRLVGITDNLAQGCAAQLYRLRHGGQVLDYIGLSGGVDYEGLRMPVKESRRHVLKGTKEIADEIDEATEARLNDLARVVPEDAEAAPIHRSPLLSYLVDYSMAYGYPVATNPVKSNMGALLTGEKRVAAVLSINNLAKFPAVESVLSTTEHLQIVTVCRLSRDEQREVDRQIEENTELLAALRPAEGTEGRESARVDTICHDVSYCKGLRLCYVNVSYVIVSENSVDDLREKADRFSAAMNEAGVILYSHQNSARAQYIASFPGNAPYGEHWYLCYSNFLHDVYMKLFVS